MSFRVLRREGSMCKSSNCSWRPSWNSAWETAQSPAKSSRWSISHCGFHCKGIEKRQLMSKRSTCSCRVMIKCVTRSNPPHLGFTKCVARFLNPFPFPGPWHHVLQRYCWSLHCPQASQDGATLRLFETDPSRAIRDWWHVRHSGLGKLLRMLRTRAWAPFSHLNNTTDQLGTAMGHRYQRFLEL